MFLVAARGAAPTLPPEVIRYADLILHNGNVLTADRDDANFTVAEAVAVRDGRILVVDTSADALKYGGPQSARIDLKGKSVIPGIIASDGDNAFAAGDLYKYVQVGKKLIGGGRALRVAPTKEALFAKVNDMVRGVAPGEMVFLRFHG